MSQRDDERKERLSELYELFVEAYCKEGIGTIINFARCESRTKAAFLDLYNNRPYDSVVILKNFKRGDITSADVVERISKLGVKREDILTIFMKYSVDSDIMLTRISSAFMSHINKLNDNNYRSLIRYLYQHHTSDKEMGLFAEYSITAARRNNCSIDRLDEFKKKLNSLTYRIKDTETYLTFKDVKSAFTSVACRTEKDVADRLVQFFGENKERNTWRWGATKKEPDGKSWDDEYLAKSYTTKSGKKKGVVANVDSYDNMPATKIKQKSTKKDAKMNFSKLKDQFNFGKVEDDAVRVGFDGKSYFKRSNGDYVRYDKDADEIVNTHDFAMDFGFAMAIPVTELKVGDVVRINGSYVVVKSKNKSINGICLETGEKKTILIEKSVLGFSFYTKIASVENMFGGETSTGAINPMMAMMMFSDKSGDKSDMFETMLMMNMFNGGSNPFGFGG